MHDTSLPDWSFGNEDDKLATAGEVLYEELWQGQLQTVEQTIAFRAQSEKLVRMMDDFSRLYPRMIQVNPAVSGWTVRSFIREGVREGDEFEELMGPASLEKHGGQK